MLSEHSTPIIRQTLPAVGAAIDKIAGLFYDNLFAAHPELLRDLFNRGNQANGEQKTALAGSIAAFAGMLVDPPDAGRTDTMLTRIAHKHASLGIAPEQYDVVHEHLFAAIAEVLGDAVTPEVAAAWDEVYWLMADTLIVAEAGLRRAAGGSREMTVTGRREETPDVVSLTFRPTDGTPAPPFRPGQYVSVQAELPDGARQIRQYSLSSAGPDWRITVKRVHDPVRPDGEVSTWLHRTAQVGDTLMLSAPYGDLTLPDGDGPLLLASAGIGTTPMLAMLGRLAADGSPRRVIVAHADRGPADHAHRDELLRLTDELPNAELHLWYEDPGTAAARTGRMDLSGVALPRGLTACLCGPLPFMRGVREALLSRGVAADAVHYEVFSPDHWLA